MPAPSLLELYCDGASRGNPGPAAYGFVVFSGGEVVAEEGKCLGITTNNVAEYEALIRGLERCRTLGGNEVVVRADSELMVRQLNGQYKVRSPHLVPLFEKARQLLRSFPRSRVLHVRREENSHADALANKALDNAL